MGFAFGYTLDVISQYGPFIYFLISYNTNVKYSFVIFLQFQLVSYQSNGYNNNNSSIMIWLFHCKFNSSVLLICCVLSKCVCVCL